MASKFKLERKVDGEWCYWGIYGESSIPQLCNAVAEFTEAGYKMYDTLRVIVIKDGD